MEGNEPAGDGQAEDQLAAPDSETSLGGTNGQSDSVVPPVEPKSRLRLCAARKGTLRRGVAVMDEEEPPHMSSATSAVGYELERTGECPLMQNDETANDEEVVSLAQQYNEQIDINDADRASVEHTEDVNADENESETLLLCPEHNGNVAKPNSRRGSHGLSKRMSSHSMTDDPEKQDVIVSSSPRRQGGYHIGSCVRRLSKSRTEYKRNKRMDSDDEPPKPEKCKQYIELCKSFWKPCCPCCEKREAETYRRPSRQRGVLKYEDSIIIPEDPFRKRCIRACMTFVYVMLVLVGGVVTYSMLADLVHSMNNPVRSIHYHKVKNYDAPGIAVYPGGAEFLACGHYYNNVVTSKVRLEQLDLVNRNCSFTRMQYGDPHYPDVKRDVLVVRGPTSFERREAIFLHFALEDATRDFFTVSYFVFPGFDKFNSSDDRVEQILKFHTYMPTFALSAGLRMWIKLIMSETYLMDDSKHTEFKVEYSVVRFVDRRPEDEQNRHLFFIFFEWKNDIIEQSRLLYTTTPWSIGAGLCGVFLTLHRVYQLAQTSYKRMQKDKMRRSIRKRTLRELRQRSMEAGSAE